MKTQKRKFEIERKNSEFTLLLALPKVINIKVILHALLDELDPDEEIGLTSDVDFLDETIAVVLEVTKAQLLGKGIRRIDIDGFADNRVLKEVMYAVCDDLGISFHFRYPTRQRSFPVQQGRPSVKPSVSRKQNESQTDEFFDLLDDRDYVKAFTSKDGD